MIDKQKFDDTYLEFDAATIVEIINIFAQQQPEIISLLKRNITNHDLVEVKKNAHKLKGTCGQLFDPVSEDHAYIMEKAASQKILAIIEIMLHEEPETLNAIKQEFDPNALVHKVIFGTHSIKNFLIGYKEPFSAADEQKLHDLEVSFMAEGMPQMLIDLKASSEALLQELLAMKKKLTAK